MKDPKEIISECLSYAQVALLDSNGCVTVKKEQIEAIIKMARGPVLTKEEEYLKAKAIVETYEQAEWREGQLQAEIELDKIDDIVGQQNLKYDYCEHCGWTEGCCECTNFHEDILP